MVAKLLEKAVAGERLSPAEGLELLKSHDLTALGGGGSGFEAKASGTVSHVQH